MKKKRYLIALSILVILGALVWFREPVLRAAGGAFGLNLVVTQPTNTAGSVSTTTLNYLSAGAGTTTVTSFTGTTDQLDVNVFVLASSTQTDLRWRVEFSHSTSTIPSQQLWFPEPIELTELATTTRIVRTSREYSWVFASSTSHRLATSSAMNLVFDQNTTGSFTFRLKEIAARWTRIIFYLSAPGAIGDSTALGVIPSATSTNAGIAVFLVGKEPL